MPLADTEILTAALKLPPEARAALADSLLQSLESTDNEEINSAWTEAAEHRIDLIDQGKAKLIPGNEVIDSIRKRIV